MPVIDADTHLREGYFLDEVYKLKGEFAKFTPRRTRDGEYHEDSQAPRAPTGARLLSHLELAQAHVHACVDSSLRSLQKGLNDRVVHLGT